MNWKSTVRTLTRLRGRPSEAAKRIDEPLRNGNAGPVTGVRLDALTSGLRRARLGNASKPAGENPVTVTPNWCPFCGSTERPHECGAMI